MVFEVIRAAKCLKYGEFVGILLILFTNFQVDNYGEIKLREPAVPQVLATTHEANII